MRHLILLVAAAALVLAWTPALAEDSSPVPPRPHETLDDTYVPVPDEARQTGPAGRVVQGPWVSVQVNVNAAGQNIQGDAANEPSIAVQLTNRTRIVVGWRQFDTVTSNFRQAGVGYSTDEGRTWTFPGSLDAGIFSSDPVLEAAADGTIYYDSLKVEPDYFTEVLTSTDGGASFDPGFYAYGGDKQWLAVDTTQGPGRGHLYQAWDYAGCCGPYWANRATAGPGSFEYPVAIPHDPYWGVNVVGPDGTVYLAGASDSATGYSVARSSTAQHSGSPMTFEGATAVSLGGELVYFYDPSPNPGGLLGQIWTGVDASEGPTHGWVYVLASVDPPGSDPMDVHLIRSTDGGLTFGAPVRVNDDPNTNGAWQWFGTLSVAGNGRLDVVWNDTRNYPGTYLSELYYASSTDGGTTWSANQQVSPPFDPHLGWPNQNKLGDYYDMVSDRVGAHVIYAATFNGEQDVYYLRLGDWDCNDNGVGDADDISSGTSQDLDLDGIPDECTADLDGDGVVDPLDNCPDVYNPDQLDSDGNGVGDACEGALFADDFETGGTGAWTVAVP